MAPEDLRELLEKVHELQDKLVSLPEGEARDANIEYARRIACYIEDEIDVQEMNLRAQVPFEGSWYDESKYDVEPYFIERSLHLP